MTHIFLTGEIQIGKSTVINKTLSLLSSADNGEKPLYGGFRTYFGPDRSSPDRCLYINEASEPLSYDGRHIIARFQRYLPPEVLSHRFDTLGSSYVIAARRKAKLIIMDECGSLEAEALRFQETIFKTLNGNIPVFGVIKMSATGWVEILRSHPKIMLITVDESNRDVLPGMIWQMLQTNLTHPPL
jgi:nucleoside-triphosphatase